MDTHDNDSAGREPIAGSNLTQIAEYTETAAALADLRQRHQGVLYDVTVPKEMRLAKEARAELRTLRTSLEKKRQELKAPVLVRGKLLDDEAKRITAEIVALEEPIDVQIKTEEARAEAERLARLEAERLRVETIQKRIDEIRNLPSTLVGKPSVIIQGQLAKLKSDELSEDEFAEHFVVARDAHAAAIARVQDLLATQQEAEAEKRRQAARDAEMEAMRERMAEQQRLLDQAEAERVERERKAAAEEAGRIAREVAEKRQREIEEQAERDRVARAEREAQERAEREAREEQEHIEREEQARVRAEQEAALQTERERQAAEQKRLDEQAAKLKREQQAAAQKAEAARLAGLGLREAAEAVVSARSNGGNVDAAIDDLAAALANDAAQAKPARAKRTAQA